MAPNTTRSKTCPRCGSEFIPSDWRTTYCSNRCSQRRRGSHPAKNCAACDEPFVLPDNYSAKQWRAQRFCSRKCAASARTTLTLTCDNCGVTYHHGKLQGLAHTFCSRSCYSAWRSSQASLDPCADEAFSQAAKRALLEQAGHRCQKCAATADLEFDHIIPRAAGGSGDVSNGQVLCATCHWDKTLGERMLIRDLLRAHFALDT